MLKVNPFHVLKEKSFIAPKFSGKRNWHSSRKFFLKFSHSNKSGYTFYVPAKTNGHNKRWLAAQTSIYSQLQAHD